MVSSAKGTTLVLGGTGTVGSRIVQLLEAASLPVLSASREGTGQNGVVFDWNESDTWGNPFAAAASGKKSGPSSGIRSVYLIAPPTVKPMSVMSFVDFAMQQGARRFVLQSASSFEPGGPAMGKVHAYLRELGSRGEVEWAVLRPTWFQQNFIEQPAHVTSIKEESKLYSATSDGRIPFVSADDIAAVAIQALTRDDPPNTEYFVLGPEPLSYGDVAETLSKVLGRKIVHVDLTSSEIEKRHQDFGLPDDYSRMLSALEMNVKYGMEDRINDIVFSLTGSHPKKFKDLAEASKAVWASSE